MAGTEIRTPEMFLLGEGEISHIGASQEWYKKRWQKMAGCGPVNAAHLVWYCAKTRDGLSSLIDGIDQTKPGFLDLMEQMWKYVTPTYRGVNSTGLFVRGVEGYARDRGLRLSLFVFDVDGNREARASLEKMNEFLKAMFEADRPVAFLNLNNGEEKNLDYWHWVLLVGYNPVTGKAKMYDQGKSSEIDLPLWLGTTTLGGGFIAIDKE